MGRPVAELIRWNASRGEFGDSDTERQIAKRIAHMKSGKAYVTQRLRRNGDVYEIRGQPLPDGGYVTTYNDITEFKRTELALLEAKQTLEQRVEERTSELKTALAAQEDAKRQAEEANATKSRFVAAASHDLLQPLNAARLFASTLGERSDDPAVIEIAERIDSSMRAAEEVLDDMLDIARLESGTMRTDIADFPIAETFEHLERQFAPLAARRGLRLRFTRPRCGVQSDRVLLRRILQNLVSNALRYTQRGGVLVSCRRRGRFAEIQVWDTGPGIPQQHQRAIFDEFRRLDRPSPWGEHGLGLGLSICHRIALLLGHELGVRSQVGRGSVFSVSVPIGSAAVSSPAAASPEAPPAAPATLVGLAVLCIDNEPEILSGMSALMTRWGVRVLTAVNAAQARAAFERDRPDVILADYRLGNGEMDGLDLLQSMRRGGVEPVPGALVTADHSAAVAERARSLGYPVLRKPVKPAALRALLGALAAQRESARGGEAPRLPSLLGLLGWRPHARAIGGEPACGEHGLRARGDAQLAQDCGHVCLYGRLRHVEVVGDLLVQLSRAERAEHAKLLRSEVGDATRDQQVLVARRRAARWMVPGRRIDLSGEHGLDRPADLGRLGRLRNEALRAVAQRRRNGLRIIVRRDDRDRKPWAASAHMGQRVEALCARHVQVEEQQVGVGLRLDGRKQRRDGIRLDEPGSRLEPADRGLERFAKQRVVVRDDDLSGHGLEPTPARRLPAPRSTKGEFPTARRRRSIGAPSIPGVQSCRPTPVAARFSDASSRPRSPSRRSAFLPAHWRRPHRPPRRPHSRHASRSSSEW